MHLGGKIEVNGDGAGQDARRPLDGLHARASRASAGDPRRPGPGLVADDQGQHRRRRLRRHRRARAGRHRPGGGDAGDGGQGAAVQGVRRRRRVPAVPRDQGRRRDRRLREGGRARRSAASTSRTSPRRAASRSSGGCATSSTSRSSTTTSTAPRSWRSPRCSTRCASSASAPEDVRVVVTGAGAAGMACTNILLAHGRRADSSSATSTGALYRGRPGLDPMLTRARRADEPGGRARHRGRAARGRRRLPRRSPARAPCRAGGGPDDGAGRDRVRDGQPDARGACPRRSPTPSRSWRRGARTTPTRSTTCSPSRACSAARSTCARARSTRR